MIECGHGSLVFGGELVGRVEEDDIGLEAGRDAPDVLAQAECPGCMRSNQR